MVAEHRAGPARRIRFEPDDPEQPPVRDPRWGRLLVAALGRLGVDVEPGPRVDDLAVVAGEITATVGEGTRVRIGVRALGDDAWSALVAALGAEEWSAAQVRSGRLPATDAVAAALLPRDRAELPLDCTCADWAMPCAHVRAVARAATAHVADDPFALLRWRGRERAELVPALRRGPGDAALPLVGFHSAGGPLPSASGRHAAAPDALLDELPPLGSALSPDGVLDAREALRPLYRRLGEGPPRP